jgi:tRNA threonylcarbamoyladenosine biosynthesis protein TsaB
MLFLAIDTSGRNGGIALARADEGSFELLGERALAGGSYSAELMPAIASLLAECKLTLAGLAGFAVASGPGSFTGLRVGLATVKALADVTQQPIAAVSVLEALAANAAAAARASAGSTVFALLDAGREEAFIGEFRVSSLLGIQRIEQQIVKLPELASILRPALIAACDESVAATVHAAGHDVVRVAIPSAVDIARIGARKLAVGDTVTAALLDADYIRRSDAELYSLPRLAPAAASGEPAPARSK